MILIISSSLNSNSKSRIGAKYYQELVADSDIPSEFLDLQDYADLPLCNAGSAYADPRLDEINQKIAAAKTIIIAAPIYNYDVNAALKNFLELTSKEAWMNSLVGFICAAGSKVSYMAPIPFANSLMLDFRCLIIPNFVLLTPGTINESGTVTCEDNKDRIQKMADFSVKMTKALESF